MVTSNVIHMQELLRTQQSLSKKTSLLNESYLLIPLYYSVGRMLIK